MSTDNSGILSMNPMGVSSDLQYAMKPSSVRSRVYRHNIVSQNKQKYDPLDTVTFYIPGGRRNTFLIPDQSYLRMTITNNSTDANGSAKLENGYAVLSHCEVYHGSNKIDDINEYGRLATTLLDFTLSGSERYGLSSMLGCETSGNVRVGRDLSNVAVAGTIGTNSYTVCLPLIGVIGTGSSKMIPVGLLADDIRVDFTLSSLVEGLVTSATNPAWQVVQPELVCTILEVSDEGMAIINSQMTNPLFINVESYRYTNLTLPVNGSAGGTFTGLVPLRFASLKSIWVAPQRTDNNDKDDYTISARINPAISEYQFRIGSALVPQKPVQLVNSNTTYGYAEGFAEVQKALSALSSPQLDSSVPADYYLVSNTGNTDKWKNGFAIAQQLSSFPNRNDTLLSGVNTLSSQVFFECKYDVTNSNFTLHIWGHHDQLLVLENGILSARF
jgi:hypothetical protein